MDNPFDEELSNKKTSVDFDHEFHVTIWKESRGRKTNTYVKGWDISEDELKQYLKDLKKSHGCNGSIKNEEGKFMVHIQGDKISNFTEFMISKGIKAENIILRGQ